MYRYNNQPYYHRDTMKERPGSYHGVPKLTYLRDDDSGNHSNGVNNYDNSQQLCTSPTSPPHVPGSYSSPAHNLSSDSWDYMNASVNLTPMDDGRTPRGTFRGVPSTGPGQPRNTSPSPTRCHYGTPRYQKCDKTDEHSPVSKDSGKENSVPSSTSPRVEDVRDGCRSSVAVILASGGDLGDELSYRARWERSRRDRKDSILYPMSRASSEPNRASPTQHSRQDSGNSVFTNGENTGIRSRSCDFAERNRSLLHSNPDVFLGQDVNKSPTMTYNNYMDTSTGSLRRDPVTHRKLPSDSAKPGTNTNPDPVPSLNRRRSINLSRLSLHSRPGTPNKVTVYGKDYGVHNSLVSLAFYAVLSLVMSVLSVQLLFKLSERSFLPSEDSVLQSNSSYRQVQEVAVAASSLVLMINLSCFLTCGLQVFFTAKLIKCQQGEERAFRYIKECSGTRSIALTGFFISVPVFLLAIMLFVVMEFRATAAIIAVVMVTVGISFSVSSMVHAYCFWRLEKTKANNNVPVFDENTAKPVKNKTVENLLNHSELSTLV